jgi:predicted transport protein
LGDRFKELHKQYLHTLGNLTLTGYNSEYSYRPFIEKRDMMNADGQKVGFAGSPLHLNEGLGELEHWNEQEILKRAERLAKLAIKVWMNPALDAVALAKYAKPLAQEAGKTYTLTDHPHLTGEVLELFQLFRKRVLNLDSSVREEILKYYIAYKTSTNFVDVVPKKGNLLLVLNMEFDEVVDLKGLCKNVTGVGKWGNGDVQVILDSADKLDDIMALVKQSFEKHMENGGN